MRRARLKSSPAPATLSPNQATPVVAHEGKSGSREDIPSHAAVYPRRKAGATRGRFTKEQEAHMKPWERDIIDPEDKRHRDPLRRKYKVREKRETGREEPTIRFEIPSVAKHCARVIVMHHMDYLRAVHYLLGPRADDTNPLKLAERLERSEIVQKCIQEELTVTGLDDKSKESFVSEMWEWLRRGSENKAMKAAGILGKGFIAEKVETVRPEELPIAGLGDAVRSMLGDATPPAGPGPKTPNERTDDIQVAEQQSRDARGPVLDPASPESPANS